MSTRAKRLSRAAMLGTSLRGRLTASMTVIFCGALAIEAGLHALEDSGHGLGGRLGRFLLGDELPEPWQDLSVLLPFGALIILLVGVVCRWSLRPLTRASSQAEQVGPLRPDARIGTGGLPSELAPLVAAMNAALDRLAEAYEVERRFTMNAAHELRTPLATLSLRLQRVRHDRTAMDWPSIDRDIATMSGLIDRLLDLARKQGATARAESLGSLPAVNLSRAARMAAAQMVPLIEAAGRTFDVSVPESLPVHGDLADLQDMVRNLIENALVHGRGRIALVAAREGDGITLAVSDQGDGVAPSLRETVFERFRKGEQSAEGSGLGLAIVREVVRRHRGTVGFVPGPDCVVRVTLPQAHHGFIGTSLT